MIDSLNATLGPSNHVISEVISFFSSTTDDNCFMTAFSRESWKHRKWKPYLYLLFLQIYIFVVSALPRAFHTTFMYNKIIL